MADNILTNNKLLSYVQLYMNKCCKDKFKKRLVSFYFSEDVATTKDVLRQNFAEVLSDQQVRRDSQFCKKKEANIDDILQNMSILDEKLVKIPFFLAIQLDHIPRYDSEEAKILSIIDRVAVIECKLSAVK